MKKLEIKVNYDKTEISKIRKAYLKTKITIPIFIMIVSFVLLIGFLTFSYIRYRVFLFYYSFIFIGIILLAYLYMLWLSYKITKNLNLYQTNKIYEETIIYENNKLYFETKDNKTEEKYIAHNVDKNKIFINIVTDKKSRFYKYSKELDEFLKLLYDEKYNNKKDLL